MKELIEKITKLCQGNPGALTILERLLTNTECIDILERYNICGSDIWQLYKDCCHENIDLMTDVLNKLPSENIKYHINHGKRGIEYDKNIRNGNVDDWIVLALKDLKEYNIYARMELENFGEMNYSDDYTCHEPHCCRDCMCFDECMEKQEDECDDELEDSEDDCDDELEDYI